MHIPFAKRLDGITGSAIRDIFKLLGQPGMISFAGGNPSPSSFEPDVVAQFTKELMEEQGPVLLQYGATEGYAPLRESTADFLKGAGVLATPEQILPTTGSTQGIALTLMALLDPGDVVLAEDPTFLGTLQAMQLLQADIRSIETDEQGAIPESVEALCKAHQPKAVYLIPTFQNPTGRTMPLERRKRMAQLAAEYEFILLEDDPYRDLRYYGDPLPSIASFDQENRVVYLSSYSKVISPGIRVGAAVLKDETLRRKVVICKQSMDAHTAMLTQAIVDRYIRTGRLKEHIPSICQSYRIQMDAMLERMSLLPEGTVSTKPEGGLFLWATLPEGYDAKTLLPKAAETGVAYVPGTHFYAKPGTHLNEMRLNFSNANPEQIATGMEKLGNMLKQNQP